jgi:5S rRNA maturation endonuclease (ribonuclease M5)
MSTAAHQQIVFVDLDASGKKMIDLLDQRLGRHNNTVTNNAGLPGVCNAGRNQMEYELFVFAIGTGPVGAGRTP